MTKVSDEAIDAMERFVHYVASDAYMDTPSRDDQAVARKIIAMLPEPLDPDVAFAREVCAMIADRCGDYTIAGRFRDGRNDDDPTMAKIIHELRARRA